MQRLPWVTGWSWGDVTLTIAFVLSGDTSPKLIVTTRSFVTLALPVTLPFTAPVMVAFGEFDIAEQPRDEVAFYERSTDITLFVLAGSYHCHNFQEGRAALWDRLVAWATEVTPLQRDE